jgi:hypothetical protein
MNIYGGVEVLSITWRQVVDCSISPYNINTSVKSTFHLLGEFERSKGW